MHLACACDSTGCQVNHNRMLQETESNPDAPLVKACQGFKFGMLGTGPKLGEDNGT